MNNIDSSNANYDFSITTITKPATHIALTTLSFGARLLLPKALIGVTEGDGQTRVFCMNTESDNYWDVKESFDEIKKLLEEV